MNNSLRFSVYDENKDKIFSCKVQCKVCGYKTSNGKECKLKLPYCWIHSKKEFGVLYRESTIDGAGKGLYADSYFKPGEWIAPIWGEELTAQEIDARYGERTAPYGIDGSEIKEGLFIDGACKRYVGHGANDALIDYKGKRLYLRANKANKAIKKGSEILVYYGGSYDLETKYVYKRSKK